MWDATDRAALIDPDLPGYALATKADLSTVGGLFRQPYAEAFGNIGGTRPVFVCPSDQAPAANDTLVIAGVTYSVQRIAPDGNGFSTLDLDAA
jgi:hypothetical protein